MASQTCRKCGTIDNTFLGVIPLRCATAEMYGWECGRVFEILCSTCGEFHEPTELCKPIEAKAGGQPDE